MSSFVWMKVLESTPQRYDRGIRLLSGGRIEEVYRRIAERIAAPGRRVLDVGCGTGSLTLACAGRGARVTGIDLDAGMLEVARGKPVPANGSVEWLQLGAAEVEDRFAESGLDAIVSCLAMSEMPAEEQDYFLRIARTRLVTAGELMLADEVLPRAGFARAIYRLRRLPLLAATYLLTQTTTRPVAGLPERVRSAGFARVEEEHPWPGFLLLHAVRPGSP
jgi:ubiquinone/menaquinone biosynthesis C-methylase UbiE